MDEVKQINKIKPGRNGEIDFLRFLFAVIIMLHHSRYILGDENCVFLGGSFAVEFFFLVSGYLMMASVDHRNRRDSEGLGTETVHYLGKKIKAFLPEWVIGWCIGFAFVLAADQVHTIKGIVQRFMDYFFELTLLRSTGLHIDAINGVMWYLSAMLLCMAILYPLLVKYPDMMPKLICPLLSVLLLGWLMRTDEMLRNPHKWLGWTYKGNVRAMAELALGVVLYLITLEFQKLRLTRIGKALVSVLVILNDSLVIRYMYLRKPSEYDFFYLFLLMVAVMLSFSGQGMLYGSFQNRVSSWLARYSTALFFAHLYLAQHINAFLPENLTDSVRLVVYVMLSLVNGLLVMGLAACWRKYGSMIHKHLKRIVVSEI